MWPRPGGFFTSANPSATPQLGGGPGFRALPPPEGETLGEAQESLLGGMGRWGYRHVITPLVENMDVLDVGLGIEQRRRLFKFTDGRGDVVALVGERTIPVARLVAGKLRTTALPLRLCYAGPVLSTDEGRFQQRRETYQVGAELVGASGPVADAEVIALAARCMEATGIRRYQIDVGHAEFFHGIMDAVRLPEAVKGTVRSALAARDFVTLEALLEGTPLKSAEHELLLRFPALRGGPVSRGCCRGRRPPPPCRGLTPPWGGRARARAPRCGSARRSVYSAGARSSTPSRGPPPRRGRGGRPWGRRTSSTAAATRRWR